MLRAAPVTIPRVTLAVAALAALVTLLYHWFGLAVPPALGWLLHADARHAASDIGALLLAGFIIEPRCGTLRFGVWLLAGVGASHALLAIVYPHVPTLYGLSAAVWLLVGAGTTGVPAPNRLRWTVGAGLAAALTVEHLLPWRQVFSLGGAPPPEMNGVPMCPIPWVHAGCFALGLSLGSVGGLTTEKRSGTRAVPAAPRAT